MSVGLTFGIFVDTEPKSYTKHHISQTTDIMLRIKLNHIGLKTI